MSATQKVFADSLIRGDQVRFERRRCNVLAVKPYTKYVGSGRKTMTVPMLRVTYRWVNNHPKDRSFTTDLRPAESVQRYLNPKISLPT